jgi:hypothetical protein
MRTTLACLMCEGAQGGYFDCYSIYYYMCRIVVIYGFAMY